MEMSDNRYAKGEMAKKEYDRIKKDIKNQKNRPKPVFFGLRSDEMAREAAPLSRRTDLVIRIFTPPHPLEYFHPKHGHYRQQNRDAGLCRGQRCQL